MSSVSRLLEADVVERLRLLRLSARRVVEGSNTGLHRSPVKGASIEFRQHRQYVAGDEPRRLDWRLLARTDRPFVKEYDEETSLRCMLMLDRSGSMGYGRAGGQTKLDFASRLVAALAFVALGQSEGVGLATFGKTIETWTPARAHGQQLARLVDVIERTAPGGASEAGAALVSAADRLDRRGLVVVVSDLLVPIESVRRGLARLRHDGHEVIVLRVLDIDEVEFPFKRFALFNGMEGEQARLCDAALARKRYLERFAKHRDELADACHATGAELATFTTDRPMVDALIGFVRQRGG